MRGLRSLKNLLNRNRRSRKLARRKKDRGINASYRFPGLFRSSIVRRIVVALILLLLVYIAVPYAYAILTFEIKRDASDGGGEITPWYGTNRLITLVIGTDQTDLEHEFIDAMALVVVDPEFSTVGVFGINPDLNLYVKSIDARLNVRTFLNNYKTEGSEIKYLKEAVENLLAVRLDRYLKVSDDGFTKITEKLEPVSVDLDYDVKDEDVFERTGEDGFTGWNAGKQLVWPNQFVAFLASDVNGINDQADRQAQLYAGIIKDIDSPVTLSNLPSILNSFKAHVKSDLSREELFLMSRTALGLRTDQIKLGFTRQSSLLGGRTAGLYDRYDPVSDSIDNDLESILYDFSIAMEQARVEILNGSGIRGLASSRSRWMTNSGGRVVHFGNSLEVEEITKIYVDDREQFPATLREIERIFNGKVVYSDTQYRHKHIGDIIVVIGKDVD